MKDKEKEWEFLGCSGLLGGGGGGRGRNFSDLCHFCRDGTKCSIVPTENNKLPARYTKQEL